MNRIINGRKPRLRRAAVLCALLLLALAPLPAFATPPEPLRFDLEVFYPFGNFTGTGSWQSSGVLTASGHASQPVRHAGWDETGWWIRNVHATATLCAGAVDDCEDAEDTITIRVHLTNLDFVPYGPASGDGRWVITGATGAYEGLQGNGPADMAFDIQPICPDPAIAGPCIAQTLALEGEGHFEP